MKRIFFVYNDNTSLHEKKKKKKKKKIFIK